MQFVLSKPNRNFFRTYTHAHCYSKGRSRDTIVNWCYCTVGYTHNRLETLRGQPIKLNHNIYKIQNFMAIVGTDLNLFLLSVQTFSFSSNFFYFKKYQIISKSIFDSTVKLGDKERFHKEQIGDKEPFPMTNLLIYFIRIRNNRC